MSCKSAINSNTATKKCGEIIITMKKNSKNVFSFNCWFCDTICIQMKKFTLHLEKEHVTELEQTTSIMSELSNKDKSYDEKETVANNILVGEIKIEDCDNVDIKSEMCEEDQLTPKFQDPLENFEVNHDEISLPVPLENVDTITLKPDENIQFKNEQPTDDVEMHNFSDHEGHSEDNFYDSDFKLEGSADKKLLKPLKQSTKANEKEIILALIEEYYKNPLLWSTPLAETCNIKQKEDILQSMTDGLNAKLKIKLKLYLVKKKLNFILKQYEKEIERQITENKNINQTDNSDLWFFENMSFLKSTIECKLKLKMEKSNHKVKPLNDNLLCDLIDIYKNYNSLWDVNNLAYIVKDIRNETLQAMLEEIKIKMNLPLDIYKLEKHLNYIHKSFAKDKQLRLDCQSKEQDFEPTCSYFKKCDFLETHQGPFRCANCKDIIETYNDFQIHKSQHDGSMPFKCQECGRGFNKIKNYTIHAKRHLRAFKFHCEICGKGYPFNAELDLHMRSHTGAQPYLCSVCGEGFRNPITYDSHIRRHEERFKYLCSVCGEGFQTATNYDNHIRRHEERFKYFCHICKKGFNHMTRLNDHVKAHLNVRDVICTVCGKGFTSRKYLNYHKTIHEGKNYSCNICGKSFAQNAGLRAHKKYHGTPIGISSIQKEPNNLDT